MLQPQNLKNLCYGKWQSFRTEKKKREVREGYYGRCHEHLTCMLLFLKSSNLSPVLCFSIPPMWNASDGMSLLSARNSSRILWFIRKADTGKWEWREKTRWNLMWENSLHCRNVKKLCQYQCMQHQTAGITFKRFLTSFLLEKFPTYLWEKASKTIQDHLALLKKETMKCSYGKNVQGYTFKHD